MQQLVTEQLEDALALKEADEIFLIEVLGIDAYIQGHLPGALSIPADRIEQLSTELIEDKQAQVIVYSQDEEDDTAKDAARRLEKLGYENVAHYKYGKAAWMQSGHTLV